MSKEAMNLRTAAEKVVELCSERPLSLGKWFIDMSEACESLREALAKPDFWEGYVPEPVKSGEGASATVTITLPAQQALDKKAENARELGLDYEPVCNKDPQGCWNVRCQLGKKCKNTSAQQEPMDFDSLLHEAEEIVRQKPTWKRFIDGTPLSNDIAVWMTVFAQDVARRTSPPAQRRPLTDEEIMDLCRSLPTTQYTTAFARAIEAKLKEKNNG